MVSQPTGSVTLLFTDIEGSTRLLERLGAPLYAEVLARHRSVLREAFERFGGYEVDEEGDAFLAAFASAGDAVAAACEAQLGLIAERWPEDIELRVRMGLHTGEPLTVPPKYVGLDVHRAARVMSAAHGGQVIITGATAALVEGAPLRDLGPHRLKDLLEPIQLYQLAAEGLPTDFPPIRSLHQTNLPTAAWPLLGRDQELQNISALVAAGARLVTLTGPGGTGKTRLALQAAGEVSEHFPDGAFFVGAASLREATSLMGVTAEAVGLRPDDDLVGWLTPRRTLLVLDNLEHLVGAAAVVANLLVGDTTVVATSRRPLHLSGERELPVDPLPDNAAVELFVSRAAAAGRTVEADTAVAEVCRRLDNLPLALELAAARAKLLSPSMLLRRLDAALPLLTGGAQDRPERHKTLRATIEWSHDLLDPGAQAGFRRLSVFRGSFAIEDADVVSAVDLDLLDTLLEHSLVKPLDDQRFFMLETLREYASERLGMFGETDEYTRRHAHWYAQQLEEQSLQVPRQGSRVALDWFTANQANLRAMLDVLAGTNIEGAARAAYISMRFWTGRGAFAEAESRFKELLAKPELTPASRAMLLERLADIEERRGELHAARTAAREALALAEPGSNVRADALRISAWLSAREGDSDQAVALASQAVDVSTTLDDTVRVHALHDLGGLLADAGRIDEGRATYLRAFDVARRTGNTYFEASAIVNLGILDLYEAEYATAAESFATALQRNQVLGQYAFNRYGLWGRGYALLGLGSRRQARDAFAELLAVVLAHSGDTPVELAFALAGVSLSVPEQAAIDGARLRGAVRGMRAGIEFALSAQDDELESRFELPLIDLLGREDWTRATAAGEIMTAADSIALAHKLVRGTGEAPE